MTISRTVYNQLFEHAGMTPMNTAPNATAPQPTEHVIRLQPTEAKAGATVVSAKNKIQMWTQDEHERFLAALEMFPAGPWKKVADFIGTKTPRQTMTHAQKYRQKISRRQRGLRNQKKTSATATGASLPNSPHHRVIDTTAAFSKHAPQPALSPYGVADVYTQSDSSKPFPMHGVAATHAAAAADPSAGRLDMLARAMQMQNDASAFAYASSQQQQQQQLQPLPVAVAVAPAPLSLSPVRPASPSNAASLPSLAQILNLRGSSPPPAAQQQQPLTTRPACNCNCSCSPSMKTEPQQCHTTTSPVQQ